MSDLTIERIITTTNDFDSNVPSMERLNRRRLNIINAQFLIPQEEFGIEIDESRILLPEITMNVIEQSNDLILRFIEPYTDTISDALCDANLDPECIRHLVALTFINKGTFPRVLFGNREVEPDERILEILGHAQRLEPEVIATTPKGDITIPQAIFLKALQRAELKINGELGII